MTMMNRETAVIRECFPTSVLLGSIERPVEPQVVVVVVAVASAAVVVIAVVVVVVVVVMCVGGWGGAL